MSCFIFFLFFPFEVVRRKWRGKKLTSFLRLLLRQNETGILLWPLGGLAFVGHSSSPSRDLWVAVAGPLTHLPQLAFWMVVEVASFAASGVGQPWIRWRVWPPSNNVWLALVTFAVRDVFFFECEREESLREKEKERKKKKKKEKLTFACSTPLDLDFFLFFLQFKKKRDRSSSTSSCSPSTSSCRPTPWMGGGPWRTCC